MMWEVVQKLLPLISPHWLERWQVRRARRWATCNPSMRGNDAGRLLVDLTVIAKNDAHTGIQRVVRSVISEMMLRPRGRSIQPVRYIDGSFRHTAWPIEDVGCQTTMEVGPDDVFVGLDLSFDAIRRLSPLFLRYKRGGTRFWFVVYDLLPLRTPQHFSAKVAVRFRWWLIATAKIADGYICISPHVAQGVRSVLRGRFGIDRDVQIKTIPMGFDIVAGANSPCRVASELLGFENFVLAVGTLEPRKGYALVLDAFDHLWADGADTTFLIVGGAGWRTDDLQLRIVRHPEYGRRLHWLSQVDDPGLLQLYDSALALIAASTDEGFGLPVYEAIARSCPVLARDIPAFRAHAAYGIRYFDDNADAAHLACRIRTIAHDSNNLRASTRRATLPTWADAAAHLQHSLASDL